VAEAEPKFARRTLRLLNTFVICVMSNGWLAAYGPSVTNRITTIAPRTASTETRATVRRHSPPEIALTRYGERLAERHAPIRTPSANPRPVLNQAAMTFIPGGY
jgi:hypothetical protein